MKAVIITGSRDFTDTDIIKNVLEKYPNNTIIIHGDCRGADRIAGDIAIERGLTVIPMPAQWDVHGRAAGPIRNECMCKLAKQLAKCGYQIMVEAFPRGNSVGTRGMIKICQEAGLEVNSN